MTLQAISIPQGVPAFTQRVSLEGKEYLLYLEWVERESAWYMTLSDADAEPILAGRKVVPDWPLLNRVTDSRRPPGELVAVDMSGQGLRPAFTDFGVRVLLTYWPSNG